MIRLLFCVVLAGLLPNADSISCHECTYKSFSSDNSDIQSKLEEENIGSSDCWDIPFRSPSICDKSVQSCYTKKGEVAIAVSGLGISYENRIKFVEKSCGNEIFDPTVTYDSCTGSYDEDLLSSSDVPKASTSVGLTVRATGYIKSCYCYTNYCNHGNSVQYSIQLMLITMATILSMVKWI